jgi:WD40 repeat protein
VASEGHVIRVFEVATGKELAVLKGHTDKVDSLAVSLDGRLLVSGSWPEGVLRVWDLDEAHHIGYIRTGSNPQLGAFAPDGRQVVWAFSDGSVRQIALPDLILGPERPHLVKAWEDGVPSTTDAKPR